MFWTIIGLILLFWFVGLILDIIGKLIHILLLVAIVILVFRIGRWISRK
ncbi:lmo0937 family membrane protein [Salirhabdus euzebyi]|nr:lmo0937 family membrane protein [Salirhabdus euzebyi]